MEHAPNGHPHAESKDSTRRRSLRHSISVPVEVRCAGHQYPVQSETTDLSQHGCYVKTLFPVAVGSQIGMRMTLNGVEVLARALVKTADQGLGNGVEFLDFIADGRHQLQEYLNSLAEPEDERNSTIIR